MRYNSCSLLCLSCSSLSKLSSRVFPRSKSCGKKRRIRLLRIVQFVSRSNLHHVTDKETCVPKSIHVLGAVDKQFSSVLFNQRQTPLLTVFLSDHFTFSNFIYHLENLNPSQDKQHYFLVALFSPLQFCACANFELQSGSQIPNPSLERIEVFYFHEPQWNLIYPAKPKESLHTLNV